MKRTLAILMALLMLLTVICSCDNSTGNEEETKKDIILTDGDYEIPNVNMNGETITVLNLDRFNGVKMDFVVPEDAADDTLDVAIYESNMRVQEQFNFVLEDDGFPTSTWEMQWIDMANHFIKNVNSGDDVYDFLHYPVNHRMELMTGGYIMDLSDLDGLHFDKPWWDANLNEVISVNGRQYMAAGSVHLMPYDGMTGVFFNKDILANYGLESPYELVRDGKWTLDKLLELGHEAVNLNSDPNWWVIEGGTSTYGITCHRDFPAHFLIGAGINYVTETDGDYNFSLESDDFYLAVEKIAEMFTGCSRGGIGGGDASTSANSWLKLFAQGRSLFMMCELKNGFEIRDSEIDFGILPMPKLREEQENYVTDVFAILHFISIPATSEHPEEVAQILDAMAYDRYKNVVPVYYDSHVAYKGLRDEDSLEMLEIMTATRTMDVGIAYGWCFDLLTEISYNITSDSIASMIASQQGAINETIDTFVSSYLS